jgi:hypothetical protein
MSATRTLPVRLATLGGAVALATAALIGPLAVIGAGPAAAAGTITQTAPFKGWVWYGTPFSDQLQVSGNIGPVTFVTDSTTTRVTVSSTGVVSAPSNARPGSYDLFGTDTDSLGDTGTWTYNLTVTHSSPIIQTAPTSGTVTTSGSSAFTDHLRTIGNIGPVTFTKTGEGTGLKVSSHGKITTTGNLAAGSYTAVGTMSDAYFDAGSFTYTLTVKPVTITQAAPTSGVVSVPGSAAFADHLRTTGNTGSVTFIGEGTGLKVSPHGKITTTGTLAGGTYTAVGTTSDAFGDTGYFTYTLIIAGPPIFQGQPTSGSVTTSGSAAFTDHLRTIDNIGPVTFTKTGGTAGLKVSSHGKITTTGTLAGGTYTAVGTMSDAFGDTGTFTYVLTVTAITITQTAPTVANIEAV